MVCSGPSSLASHNKFRCQMNNEHHLWRCIHCDRSFRTQAGLHMHKNIHKGLKPYKCRICGKAFSRPKSRNRHYSLHFIQTCSCQMCGMVFGDTISLGRHERAFHAFRRLSTGKFECVECHKLFANWKSLRRHKKRVPHTNTDASKCKTCGKLFRERKNLLRHEALHKPSGLYKCHECGLCFMSRNSLSNHVKVHLNKTVSESKPSKGGKCQKTASNTLQKCPTKGLSNICEICKAGFKYSFNLARHIREKHPQVKIVKCGKCSKVCVDKHRLALHIAIRHTGKNGSKPHSLQPKQRKVGTHLVEQKHCTTKVVKCRQCNLTFLEYQLRNHTCIRQKAKGAEAEGAMKVSDWKDHSPNLLQSKEEYNSEEFRCEFCSKPFPSLSLMYRHRAAHFRKNNPALPASFVVPSIEPTKESPRLDDTECSNGKFRCEVCYKEFPSLQLMHCHRGSHFRKKDPSREISRERCDKSFYSKKSQSQHKCYSAQNGTIFSRSSVKCGKSETFRCNVCNKSFLKETSLRSHMTHHSRNASQWNVPPSNSLPKCSPESSKLRAKENSFKCDICARKFTSKDSLKSHKSHHSRAAKKSSPSLQARQKDFQGQLASSAAGSKKTASTVNNLNTEQIDSNAQQPCVCNVCFESFQSNRSLSQHKRSHVGMNTAFVCSICHKGFSSKWSLLRHKRRQHDGKYKREHGGKYKCQRQHDGKYKCHLCGERLRTVEGRQRHLLYKHGIYQGKGEASRVHHLGCLHCDKRFMTHNGRFKHMRKYHIEHTSVDGKEFQSASGMRVNKRHASEGVDDIKTIDREMAERTQTCSESAKGGLWKCQYCNKEFQSYSGMRKHVKKKHAQRKRSDPYQGNKPGGKDGIKTTNNEVTEKTQTCSKVAKFAPLKCPYCSKEFQSDSGMKKHVKKKHAKRKRLDPYKGYKPAEKDGTETTNGEVAETCSKVAKFAPLKCQYCSKEFQSDSGMKKHVKKKHAKRKRMDHYKGYKPAEKDGTQTTNGEVAEKTQTCLKLAKSAPFKCQYCSKEFQSDSGMKKHVKKKHPKGKRSDSSQLCKPKGNGSIEVTSSETAKGTEVCHRCEVRFIAFGSGSKHIYCVHCSRELLEENATGPGFKEQFVGNSAHSRRQSISEKRNRLSRPFPASARAFQCQYCLKGLSSINNLYKHIMIAHTEDFGSNPRGSCNRMDDQSLRRNISIRQACTTQLSREAVQNCDQKDADSANDLNGRLKGVKFTTVRNKLCKARTKRTALSHRFRCRYCRREFSTQNSRRRHEVKFHEKQVGSSSLGVGKNGINKPLNESPLSVGDLAAFTNCNETSRASTDGLRAKECHSVKSFPCEYCPKEFSRFNSRFKHVMLVHTRAANSTSKVCQLKQRVVIERSTRRTGETILFHNNHSTCSSLTPAKRKTTISSSDCQPESKKFRRRDFNFVSSPDGYLASQNDISADHGALSEKTLNRSKAFPCEFCDKRFSMFSLQCKHFFLVHSGSQALAQPGPLDSKSKVANKSPETSKSLLHVTSNECVSITDDDGILPRQHSFSSQSAILRQCISAGDNCSSVSSTSESASESYKCGICCATLRTKGEWTKHCHEIHNGKVGKTVRGINGLSRPPLRTISSSLQNSNKLKSLRSSRGSRTEATFSKQVEGSSMRRSKFVNSRSSVSTVQSQTELTKRFKCDICLVWFSSQRSVSRHKQSRHSDKKPFQCSICGFATKRKDSLPGHERKHFR